MTGKEAGLFMPSGTLCNLVAVAVHCRPGQALIAERSSHVVTSELGGAAVVAGALSLTLEGERGLFDIAAVDRALDALSGTRAPMARLGFVRGTDCVMVMVGRLLRFSARIHGFRLEYQTSLPQTASQGAEKAALARFL